ncbi:MAG: TauD/TfdA family dioxygenase [Alphaproteobacteria bacterium]|nr:TauD/TfdA family dioxygenase [Alphaproteobacteria bacterium]
MAQATPSDDPQTVPLSSDIAAEIRGVDLSQPVSDATFAEIYSAWLGNLVLLFRDQELTDPQLIAFSRRFGDLDLAPIKGHGRAFVEGLPEMFIISNVVENGRPIGSLGDGECLWHTDMSYTEIPPKASCLYSLEVPDGEGNTGFLNMYTAYETLPAALREKVEGRSIKHEDQYTLDGLAREEGGEPLAQVKARGAFDPGTLSGVSHPIVRTHPETGRKALYIGRRQNTYVDGLSVEESDDLLDAVWAHVAKIGQTTWHHRWRPGDFIIWDNRCAMHRRDEFPPTCRRIMHRTQVKDVARPM